MQVAGPAFRSMMVASTVLTKSVTTTPPSAYRVVEVVDESTFGSLESEWNETAGRARNPSVFLTHEWFAAAWAWRRETASLALLVARHDSREAAVLPLVRPHARPRSLELLTVPDTQFADLVVSDENATVAAETFATVFAKRRDWDVLRFDYLMRNSAIATLLADALRCHGMRFECEDRGRNAYVALDVPWETYFASRSRRLKKALNLAANRLRKAGDVRIEHVGAGADSCTRERALEAAISISRASWKAHTGNSLDQPGPQAFIRSLSQSAHRRGWLSLWMLHLDERPLAMEYQLVADGCVHALRSDFLAECSEISPGTQLFRQLLEALFGRGHTRYYLGPGDNAYKARWSDQGEPLVRVHVYNNTWRGRLRWFLQWIVKPPARRLRDRLKRPAMAEDDGEGSARA